MNVLSLFDGMSCGQQALERAGIKVDNYFASEIDKYAIQVTMANYPNTIQLGSVVNVVGENLPKIDILIGGSPCQSFSFAGKRKGMSTKDEQEILTLEHYLRLKSEGFEFEGQSYLFWEYMRLLNEVKPKYFLLENVMMGKKWEKILSEAIGVKPIMINSSLVSGQNRKRLYWTNIGLSNDGLFGESISGIEQPIDKGILLKDILEENVEPKYFLSEKMNVWLERHSKKRGSKYKKTIGDRVESCLTVSGQCAVNLSADFILEPKEIIQLNSSLESGGKQPYQQNRVYDSEGISPALCANKSDLLILGGDYRNDEGFRWRENGKTGTLAARARNDESCGQLVKTSIIATQIGNSENFGNATSDKGKDYTLRKAQPNGVIVNSNIRRLTPVECERLQTVKDNYTNHVSDSQRYKMLGNGWTVDVIVHILNYIK